MTIVDLGDVIDLINAIGVFLVSPLGLLLLVVVAGRVVIDRLIPRRRRRRSAGRPCSRSHDQSADNLPQANGYVDDVLDISPEAFEHFVADLFRRRGYKATVIGRDGDHGIDIVVTNPEGERELVQCKQWKNKWIGEGVVRDFFGAFVDDGHAVRGYIVTTSFFSNAAREWARGKPIDLIDRHRLEEAIEVLVAS